jgi:hypothetical protein
MKRSDSGWPDLILCKPPRLLAVELKGPRGRLSPEQTQWLEALSQCNVETYVSRAGSDRLNAIAKVLR